MKKQKKSIFKSVITMIIAAMSILFIGCSITTKNDSATSSTSAEYATYTDLAGKTVKVSTNIQRIVLLRSRDIYELSSILGKDTSEKIVGWGPDLKNKDNDGYKKFIEAFPKLENIQDTGDVQNDSVNIEKIVSLNPDLIIADKYMLDSFQSVKKLVETGLPVVCIDESTDPLVTPQQGIRLLGKILGKEKRANEIADYADQQVDIIYKKIASINEPEPSVYLECGDTGPSKFSDTYSGANDQSWGTVLSKLKVKNIADGVINGMAPISPELVISKNPDVIVITGQNWTSNPNSMYLGFDADTTDSKKLLQAYTTRVGWSDLSAVKNEHVYSVFHNLSMHIFDFYGLQTLAKDFYPSEFNDLEPDKNLNTFFDKYMPISYSGTFSMNIKK